MVEPDGLRPAFLRVTAFAALSELVLVNIIQTVTIGTALAGFFLFDGDFVTRLAFQSLVLPAQREFCISVVVEFAFRPSVRLMTGRAIRTVPALVNIVVRMTVAAIFLLFLLVERSFVTGDTLDLPMASMKFETGIPVVVEFGFVPAVRNMAFLAFGAEPATVGVV